MAHTGHRSSHSGGEVLRKPDGKFSTRHMNSDGGIAKAEPIGNSSSGSAVNAVGNFIDYLLNCFELECLICDLNWHLLPDQDSVKRESFVSLWTLTPAPLQLSTRLRSNHKYVTKVLNVSGFAISEDASRCRLCSLRGGADIQSNTVNVEWFLAEERPESQGQVVDVGEQGRQGEAA